MIKVTTETKLNKKEELVDDSLYIDRLDKYNLILGRGIRVRDDGTKTVGRVLGYFGDIETIFKRGLNYAIKDSDEELSFKNVVDKIAEFHRVAENIDKQVI